MTITRSALFAALAVLFVAISSSHATAQTTSTAAAGEYVGWVQWSDGARINNVGWYLNSDGTMRTSSGTPEYGFWIQTNDSIEFLYFCSGEYLCHYRGRIYNDVIRGAATSNEGHTASFEMRRQRR